MTDLEDRLRDAFTARTDLVTPQSLRPESAPPARRRLPRWVLPGITGLAVAATAAGVLVATGATRDGALQGPAGSPSPSSTAPSSAPSSPPSRSTTSSHSPSPAPSSSSSTTAPTSPSSAAVPPLSETVKGSGWTVRVPVTWHASASSAGSPAADVTCVGPAEQPCQLRLAAGLDPQSPPRAGVLGGGVLPGFGANACRQVGTAQGTTISRWACGSQMYEQVVVPARMLLAVAYAADAPVASAVAGTLQADPGYVRRP